MRRTSNWCRANFTASLSPASTRSSALITARGKGLFWRQYNYQNLRFRIDKRFYLSQLGYADVTAEGGYLFGQVPFPLLTIHQANQTYTYDPDSYNLMNFLEFVSDHYASMKVDYCLNGFVLNKFPLLKKLKLREYISFKALYGGVRDENNPALHPSLLNSRLLRMACPKLIPLAKRPTPKAASASAIFLRSSGSMWWNALII